MAGFPRQVCEKVAILAAASSKTSRFRVNAGCPLASIDARGAPDRRAVRPVRRRPTPAAGLLVLAATLVACVSLPGAYAELPWVDLWGDRGSGVTQRDLQACASALEDRRSAVAGCMQAHGWVLR